MTTRTYRHLDIITAAFVTVLILSNISSAKILSLGWFSFDGGTIIFPLSYIFGDILTEVYGYARSRRVIWTGFAMNLLMVLVFWFVGKLPPAFDWPFQESFMNILGVIPRIVLGSLCAFLVGEFMNSFILAKMKVKTNGKYFFARTIGSTMIGQFLDTSIFLAIAFIGVLPLELIGVIWVSNYIFKIATEIVLYPITKLVVAWLKKQENEDYFDRDTNFSPVVLK